METAAGKRMAGALQFSVRDLLWLFVSCGGYLGLIKFAFNATESTAAGVSQGQAQIVFLVTLIFWPAPLAVQGLIPRSVAGHHVTPLVSAVLLWRICGLLYPLTCLFVVCLAFVSSNAWIGLAVGYLGSTTLLLASVGALVVVEGGKEASDGYPGTHWIGLMLFLYWMPATLAALFVVIGLR